MNPAKWITDNAMAGRSLYYKLNVIFGLFFLLPVFGFLYFAVKYDILSDRAIPYYFIGVLACSLAGLAILRTIFDRLSGMSRNVNSTLASLSSEAVVHRDADELETIADTYRAIEKRFCDVHGELVRRVSDIAVLRELADLCYVTSDSDDLLHMVLERALKLADADIGSVMMLDTAAGDGFIVRAAIGLGDRVSIGDRVAFSKSIAKYAVINKSPLVIENIETDSRFGRVNRPRYGTKSFVCLPIKTIRDIIGVITISRRNDGTPFTADVVNVVTPLISIAAFTFENIRLIKEREEGFRLSLVLERVCDILGSSLKDRELVQAVLSEIRTEAEFRRAVLLVRQETRPHELLLYDYYESGDASLREGTRYSATAFFFEQVMRQGESLVIDDTEGYPPSPERDIIDGAGEGSALAVPLKHDGAAMGLIILCGMKRDVAPRIRCLMEQISSSVALAIIRSELASAVTKRGSELETLRQIGGALASSTFDMDQVLSYTMDMIRGTMNVEAGSLILVKDNELEFTVAFGRDIEKLRKTNLKQGQGIAGYVAARGETVAVNDMASSTYFSGGMATDMFHEVRSVLAVPLISQGKVIGVLEVLNKIHGDFNNDDIQLLQSIASSVSIALENARLYGETVSLAEHEREVRRIFQKFVPKEIVDKIIHGTETGRKVHDEFRTLTLLNIDIRGFSGLAKRIGPQKTVSLLNYFFSGMGGIVFKHDGIVDKYLGDGFMALFGAPLSSSSDADNAVRASLEMKEALLTLNQRVRTEFQADLTVGISIHTGEVVVGNIGFEKKMDYTVIGDSVNALFRIQNLTKNYVNGILMSEMTLRAAQSRFDVREVGKSDIDENRGEITIFEVLGLLPDMKM